MGEGGSMAGYFPILVQALPIQFPHPQAAHLLRRGEKWLLYSEEEQSGVWMIKACSLTGGDSGNLKCQCWGQTGDCGP